jgi:hypothetical protein
MDDRLLRLEQLIAEVLDESTEPGSKNRITVSQLRTWASEYLQAYDEELAQFPDLVNNSHWDLWMADYNLTSDSVFVVMVFRPSGIEVLVGKGAGYSIRVFCERDCPRDMEEIPRALRQRFQIQKEQITIARDIAELWLGRTFSPQDLP